ncbi:hypothetical protein FRACYDRAFT_236419 [Fragilariopsis cylindrus CCMP1102]|uniref:Uncharacterized protein n=1 Tax=Fragilariopsis cylindrus CCMP1102 TaxID=635003 RepID=A0A1E7FQG6_9STRA|nr:hypothetical protein FRACYDRAFT_236419 [Fragilariopsis cylindrus CCMP1102]|eukprot:OEU20345.1 hypothetical protein FRACYDRAFT_236419 [Fragilariopsis cylindrus CCMP1102]
MSSGQQPNANLGQPVKPPVTVTTRVAVPTGDDPLAAGAITQTQNMTPSIPSKQQQNFHQQHQNAIPAPPPPPIGTASVEAKTTTGNNNTPTTPSPVVPVRGGGGGGVETSVSPSSKSLDALADDFLSSKPPPILLSPNPLPRGEAGIVRLRTLVERRAWEIMILQCNAWLMLRRYTDLSKEIERWNFLTQNDTTAKSPEWIPWSIHILAGQSCEYNPDNKESSVDILCHLREQIPSTECGWLASVDNALTNIYIRRGEWRLAIGSLDRVFDLIQDATQAEVQSLLTSSNDIEPDPENTKIITSILMKAYMCEILSRQGRIFLQAGAVFEAGELFEDAKTIWSEVESSSSSSILLPKELSYHNESLKDAVVSLEGLVRDDPAAFLTERVAFNLCTLYELGADSTVATRNKRVLQLIAKRFFLHDIGPESFRVT